MSHAEDPPHPCRVTNCGARLTTEQRLEAHEARPHDTCGICAKASIRRMSPHDKHFAHCSQHPDYDPEDLAAQSPTVDQYANRYGGLRSTYLGEWEPPTAAQTAASYTVSRPPQQPVAHVQHQGGHSQPQLPRQPGPGEYRGTDGRIYQIPPTHYMASDGQLYPHTPAR